MARQVYDGVIEAVRYSNDGKLSIARAYERLGPTYSDYVLLSRDEIILRLKKGKKFALGTRRPYLASTFDVSTTVRLIGKSGKDLHLNIEETKDGEYPAGVRLF
jgi:hypothetical protein